MNTQFGRAIVAIALSIIAGAALARGSLGGTYDSLEYFTYGVCRGTDPACYHNWSVTRQNRVLVFSRTAAERNDALGVPLGAGVNTATGGPALDPTNVAQAAIRRLLAPLGIVVDVTESVGSLPNSSNYAALIFLDTSGDVLWDHGKANNPTFAVSTTTSAYLDAAKVNLRQYMRAGGGFVGIHNALGTEPNWYWFVGLLGNANRYDSAGNQQGTVQIQASDSSTDPLGSPGTRFSFTDTFYTLTPFPTEVKFLATVDESTLAVKKRAPRTRRVSPCRLVPVLQRRPRLADDAGR